MLRFPSFPSLCMWRVFVLVVDHPNKEGWGVPQKSLRPAFGSPFHPSIQSRNGRTRAGWRGTPLPTPRVIHVSSMHTKKRRMLSSPEHAASLLLFFKLKASRDI